MNEEMLEAARQAIRNPKPSSAVAINEAALRAAREGPVVVNLNKIVGFLSGAPQAGQQANQQYQNAANQSGQYYNDAMNKIISATGGGSPAATTFGNEEKAALQPLFNQQDQGLAAREAAMGIGASGAGKNDFTQLGDQQAATLAGLIAPLYQQSLGAYNQAALGGAGAQSGLVGQGAGAYNNAYGGAINDFYQGLTAAGSAAGGAPPGVTGGSPHLSLPASNVPAAPMTY